MNRKPTEVPAQETNDSEREPSSGSTPDRRAFTTTLVGGVGGFGALLALAGEAGAASQSEQKKRALPELHKRELDRDTLLAIERTGMELIAYAYGVEARGQLARDFLSVGCRGQKSKNGTVCTTCCHPDRTYSPDME